MTSKKFVAFTRVYKNKGETGLNSQKITVAVDKVASVRPSNRLGFPDHRVTITLNDGTSFDLADTYSEVRKAIGA